jgi:hypothetical protein
VARGRLSATWADKGHTAFPVRHPSQGNWVAMKIIFNTLAEEYEAGELNPDVKTQNVNSLTVHPRNRIEDISSSRYFFTFIKKLFFTNFGNKRHEKMVSCLLVFVSVFLEYMEMLHSDNDKGVPFALITTRMSNATSSTGRTRNSFNRKHRSVCSAKCQHAYACNTGGSMVMKGLIAVITDGITHIPLRYFF